MNEKPFSFTSRGKLLSVVGGLLGGPLGVIASPVVLMAINYYTRKRSMKFNRFTLWAVFGVILAPVCWIPVIAAVLFSTALHINNHEITNPSALKKYEEWFECEKWFGQEECSSNDEMHRQKLKERFPDKSEEWINCIYNEGTSGGSANNEICNGK